MTCRSIKALCLPGVLLFACYGFTPAGLLPVAAATTRPQEGQEEAKEQPTKQVKSRDKDDQESDDAPAKKTLAVVGGDIITVTRETIRGGTILIEDGKITAVGTQVDVPDSATIVDATNQIVTPGFISLSTSRVGLQTSRDRSARVADGLDPFDNNVRLALAVGITTGCQQISGNRNTLGRAPGQDFPFTERFPGLDPDGAALASLEEQTERDYGEFISTCPCCGLPILPTDPLAPTKPTPISTRNSAVIKMSYGVLDGMLVSENAFLDINGGAFIGAENQRNWRQQIDLARQYLKDQAAHERATAAGKKEKPPRKPVSDDMLQLVQGKIALRVSSNTVSEMQNLIQLAQELDYKLVIDGAAESWVIGQQLAEADVGVILTPRVRRDPQFGAQDRSGTWIETPRVLEGLGVPFAVTPLSSSISLNGLAGRDLTSLPLEAAFAVRGGASERKALAAITIVPATMMGMQDRLGSIEVGKDADLLILNGPPLDYRTYVEQAIVNGHLVYERKVAPVLPVE